MKKEERKKEI